MVTARVIGLVSTPGAFHAPSIMQRGGRLSWILVFALCVLWLGERPLEASPAPATPASAPGAPAKSKKPGVPYWADDLVDWTVDTPLGRMGISGLIGGQLVHGWAYTIHLGPFGSGTVQGPSFKFHPGPHTRKSVIGLIIALAALGVTSGITVAQRKAGERTDDQTG